MKRRIAPALVACGALLVVVWLVTRSNEERSRTEAPSETSGDHDARIGAHDRSGASATTHPDGGDVARASRASAPPGSDESDRAPPGVPPPSTPPRDPSARANDPRTPHESARGSAPRRLPDGGLAPGRLGAEQIREVVRAAIPELRFCFEWQLSRHPDLAGRVTLELRIAEDGTVDQAEIGEEDLGDETVLRCFRSVTSRMQFPPPEDGPVTVRYPITLSPDPDPETPTEAAAP